MRWPDSLRHWNRWSFLLLIFGVGFLLLMHASGMGPLGALEGWIYGRSSASDCIDEGQPHLLYLGLSGAQRRGVLDADTGLPCYSVGCVATSFAESQVSAHNSRVLDALEDGRLKGRTFAGKVRSVEEVEAAFAGGKPTAIERETSVGVHTLEIIGGSLWVRADEHARRYEVAELYLHNGAVDVLIVDEGSTLLLRRREEYGAGQAYLHYHSVDLPHRLHLQGWRKQEAPPADKRQAPR